MEHLIKIEQEWSHAVIASFISHTKLLLHINSYLVLLIQDSEWPFETSPDLFQW